MLLLLVVVGAGRHRQVRCRDFALYSQSLGTPSEPRPALLRAVRAHRVTTPALVTPFEYKTPQGTFGQVPSTFNHGTCRRLPAGIVQAMISLAQPLLKLFVCRS